MHENSPLVSIGIALYNGAEYITETLNSINNQTYSNIEIIIVDDGSKDDSLEQLLKITNADKNVKVINFIMKKVYIKKIS